MISRLLPALAATLSAAAFAAHFEAPLSRASQAPTVLREIPSRASMTAKSASTVAFRAPALAATTKVSLPELAAEKVAAAPSKPHQPRRIGTVRTLETSAAVDSWSAVDNGFATRALVSSEAALGIRARLDLSGFTSPIEVRVQGNDGR